MHVYEDLLEMCSLGKCKTKNKQKGGSNDKHKKEMNE